MIKWLSMLLIGCSLLVLAGLVEHPTGYSLVVALLMLELCTGYRQDSIMSWWKLCLGTSALVLAVGHHLSDAGDSVIPVVGAALFLLAGLVVRWKQCFPFSMAKGTCRLCKQEYDVIRVD